MCDLNEQETATVVDALTGIRALADRLGEHVNSITETNYMRHEELAVLLAELRDATESARAWVAAKPLAHAGHEHAGHEHAGHEHAGHEHHDHHEHDHHH
ncbi:hypothetical protein [Catellatospora tritici]|uniref:hypothetical protein n=1 Tax=Catellatospora tritici TaxID=2851566 RepID=UPI001C2D197D|nr:hypothetical protein [Catellatospora tritici]MBV1854875.1 hypothetical protein [Catellatospora tritici]